MQDKPNVELNDTNAKGAGESAKFRKKVAAFGDFGCYQMALIGQEEFDTVWKKFSRKDAMLSFLFRSNGKKFTEVLPTSELRPGTSSSHSSIGQM